jgi:recombination protein RecT
MAAATQQKKQQVTTKEHVREIELTLKQMRERLVAALPAHIPVQSFISTVLTACTVEPKLVSCDRHSLFLACLKAARDGLLPDGREAALAPFWNKKRQIEEAVYMPMVAGLLKKVRNSGELASLAANPVYENDVFEYELGDNERIMHKPVFRGARGQLVGAYAIARTKDGAIYRRVLNESDIALIKAASKGENTPWNGPFVSEMWVKSAIRRLSKILPQSSDINAYLNSGPPLPAADADSVLPDATGEEGLQSAEFELRTRAIAALRDETSDAETLEGYWTGILAEYKKMHFDVPLEVEDVYQVRKEALKAKPDQK